MRWFERVWPALCLAVFCALTACGPGPEIDPGAAALDKARQAWLAGDYAQAEERYQRYLQDVDNGPQRVEAWKRLADIALNVWGNPDNGLKLLEAALLEAGPDSPEQAVLSRRAAEVALAANNPAKALAHLDNIASTALSGRDRVMVELLREQAMGQRHDPDGAVAVLESCRQKGGPAAETAPCSARLAVLLSELGRQESALAIWQSIYDDGTIEAKIRAQAGFALAEAAEARKDKATARELYEAIKDWYPNPKVVERKLEYIGK